MIASIEQAAKAKSIRDLFNRFGRIYIVVDATASDVEVPDFLAGDPSLRLVLNMRMPQQIHIRDHEIASDFSFSGRIHACRIPMARIWAAYSPDSDINHGLTWEDSIPETIRILMQAAQNFGDGAEEFDIEEFEEAISQAVEAKPEQPAGRQVGHLRVVK
ncbi:MAG: hypothetical protein COS35_06415 [Zetaproteobacteria bacterium CG02_land_8_20_14_3_00_50_9]|nr:MAG: hypothetical protein COW62_05855 [Zetaproteobacteria bacterium CG17_big_fil_post_rev_8_21_14_2_50_50_13]PIV30475.1 MAG: hypothetical protein COS35_06415 [Zetaproteobacteria bacterium CG02_land_8_20_14_3_00_50_9]PIY54897.1 MAG: hypothetical protein COZ00_12375 [Zetaproteobacteria bacterium CG_4_10_14_0_8_um_filter_49_80]